MSADDEKVRISGMEEEEREREREREGGGGGYEPFSKPQTKSYFRQNSGNKFRGNDCCLFASISLHIA